MSCNPVNRIAITATLAVVVAFSTYGESLTFTVDAWNEHKNPPLPGCPIVRDDGTPIVEYAAIGPGTIGVATFLDPLPSGSILTGITARLFVAAADPGSLPANVRTFVVPTAGQTWTELGAATPVTALLSACVSAGSSASSGQLQRQLFDLYQPLGIQPETYAIGGSNRILLDTDAPWFLMHDADLEITLTYIPPVTLIFDLSQSSTEDERKVLIGVAQGDSYTSSDQSTDGSILIRVRATRGATPIADLPVYFWLEDPRSTAAYELAAATPNDNEDPYMSGLLAFGMVDGNILSNTSATTDFDGFAETQLTVTNQYAGDNYRVIASTDQAIGSGYTLYCLYSPCEYSGTLTAWKRAYVETDKMFTRGAFLAADVRASQSAVEVKLTPPSVLSELKPNKSFVTFVHAPPLNGSGPYYSETVRVTAVDKKNSKIKVERLDHDYFGPPLDSDGVTRITHLADAVGVASQESGPAPADLFPVEQNSLIDLYKGAFVEYSLGWLNDPVPYLPRLPQLKQQEELDLARKWFRNKEARNAQHLLAGHSSIAETLGYATYGTGEPWAWVYNVTIDSAGPFLDSGKARLRGEVTAHELTHTWGVQHDATTTGSNEQMQWNSSSLHCSLHDGYSCEPIPVCGEFSDGVVDFHFIMHQGVPNSEYLLIRYQEEPLPY